MTAATCSETEILLAVRGAVARLPGVLVWRNNTGALRDRFGRVVRYGLGVGSADLIGIKRGRFFALEVKGPHTRVGDDQLRWLEQVRLHGGVAAIVRSVEEALQVLGMIT